MKRKKDASYYFPHDVNATEDEKIKLLLTVYGFEGYGWYWRLLELMRQSNGYRLSFKSKYFYNGLGATLRTSPEKAKQFIDDCLNEFVGHDNTGLFVSDADGFWSESFMKRMAHVDKIRAKRREWGINGAISRWKKPASQSKESSSSDGSSNGLRNGSPMGDPMRSQWVPNAKKNKNKKVKVNEKVSKSEEPVEDKSSTPRRGETAHTGQQLMDLEWVLRCKDAEFKPFCSEIQQLIQYENKSRNGNQFVWIATMGTFESDMRNLIYKLNDKKKENILYEVLNSTKQKFNWPLLVRMAIQYTIRMSVRTKIASPFKYTMTVLNTPSIINSAVSEGMSK